MRRVALWIVVGVSAIIALAWLLTPNLVWDGAAVREVRLTLLDGATSTPIAGANVRHRDRIFATTDTEGKCQGLMSFGAAGKRTIFGRSGNWRISGELTIATTNGRTHSVDLDGLVTNSLRRLSDDAPVEVTIRLDSSHAAPP